MAALCERLPGIDFVMSMGLPGDVPAQAGDLAQFAAMLAGTRKPLLATAHDAAALRRMRDMAALCGEARSFACYAMPDPPLVHSAEALDKVMACAELEIPLVYAPAPAAGTTAPASLAAVIAVGNAETLSGLVVHQLARRGAPFVYGVGCGVVDMRTAVDVYAAPEHFLGNAAATDLARFYGLPSFAYAGVADAKLLDEQWAAEAGITAVLGALSRATLLHDVGYLESGLQSSYQTIVLGAELVGFARALLAEVGVDDKALALNEIDAVGPGGSHLGRDLTRAPPRLLVAGAVRPRRVRPLACGRRHHPEGARGGAHRGASRRATRLHARPGRARAPGGGAGHGHQERIMSDVTALSTFPTRLHLAVLSEAEVRAVHEAALALLGAGAAAGVPAAALAPVLLPGRVPEHDVVLDGGALLAGGRRLRGAGADRAHCRRAPSAPPPPPTWTRPAAWPTPCPRWRCWPGRRCAPTA